MIFAQLAATLRARGVTVSAHLQELYRRCVVLSVGVIACLFANQDMDFSRSVIRARYCPCISSHEFWKDEQQLFHLH